MKLSGTYSVVKWVESPIRPDSDGMRTSRASVELLFIGDIQAQVLVEYLMFYTKIDEGDMHNSQAKYVGQIQIVGSVNGKVGSFSLTDSGSFQGGLANSHVEIIAGSGAGELSTVSGFGSYQADSLGCKWELELEF